MENSKILIVDVGRPIRELLELCLINAGFSAAACGDAQPALKKLRAQKP